MGLAGELCEDLRASGDPFAVVAVVQMKVLTLGWIYHPHGKTEACDKVKSVE